MISTTANERLLMAFKPNYGRERAERERAARARSEEKQCKKDEKIAQRKAARIAAEPLPNNAEPLPNNKDSGDLPK